MHVQAKSLRLDRDEISDDSFDGNSFHATKMVE